MQKILTMLTALLMALGLMAPAYAAEKTSTDLGEYTESQQYVYLAQGANLYLGPDTSYEVYGTSETKYCEEIIINGTYTSGWVKYYDSDEGIWLYIAPEDVIYCEADAYTKGNYNSDRLAEKLADISDTFFDTCFLIIILLFGGVGCVLLAVSDYAKGKVFGVVSIAIAAFVALSVPFNDTFCFALSLGCVAFLAIVGILCAMLNNVGKKY